MYIFTTENRKMLENSLNYGIDDATLKNEE